MPQEEINKILIIRLSSLGDILLTTPVIRAIRKKYPSTEIHFVVKKGFEDSIKTNKNIDKVHIFEKDRLSKLKNEIKQTGYNLIFDLQNNWRSRELVNGVQGKVFKFNKPTFKKLLLVWTKINLLKDSKSITQRYAESAEVALDDFGLELYIPESVKSMLPDGKKYIGLCPGAKHFTKRWPEEDFIQLGNEISKAGYTILLFGGKTEAELCGEISGGIINSINCQNDDKLLQLAANMQKCIAVITNDSGLMHVASALDIPVIAIFGSTVKEFGFTPYGVKNIILENKSLSCRPCSHIGKEKCPKKHFKCMVDVTPHYVLTKTEKFLSSL